MPLMERVLAVPVASVVSGEAVEMERSKASAQGNATPVLKADIEYFVQ